MTDTELQARESSRDLEAELIESVRQMAEGKTSLAYSPVITARKASGFSQGQFAVLLGFSHKDAPELGARAQATHGCGQNADRHRAKESGGSRSGR